jgi:hypothetical protein
MSLALQHHGVIDVFTGWASSNLAGLGLPWPALFGALHLLFFVLHYLFASQTAHVGALYAAFLSLMLAGGEGGGGRRAGGPPGCGATPTGRGAGRMQRTMAGGAGECSSCQKQRPAHRQTTPAGVPPKLAAMSLAYNCCLQGGLTHYASSQVRRWCRAFVP